jgi:hypothetical protein
MKDEGIADPVRWTLEQLKTRFPSMVKQAGYEEIAEKIDQQSSPIISPVRGRNTR